MNEIKNRKRYFIFVTLFVILAAVASVAIETKKREDFDKRYYQVVDEYDTRRFTEEELNEIYSREDFVENLQLYNGALENSHTYQFIGMNTMPIEIIGHWDKPDNLVNGYGHKDLKNQNVEFEGDRIEITPVDALQVTKESQSELFHRAIFQNNDFRQNGNAISLILGSGFKEYYKIGDQIEFIYLEKKWKGIVTGFLENGERMELDDSLAFDMDKFMVLPFFEELDIENNLYYDHIFEINFWLAKNFAYLKLENKEDYEKAKKYIEDTAMEYDLNYTLLRGY